MSCTTARNKTTQAAAAAGIPAANSKNGYVTGSTDKILPSVPAKRPGGKRPQAKKSKKRPVAYSRLPQEKRKKIRKSLAQAALEKKPEAAREQLVPLVKEFGVSAVRVGINNEARRQGKEGEGDENAKRYKDLLQLLPVRKLARNKTRKSGTKTKSAKAGKPEAKKEKPAAGQTPFFETQAVKSGRERRIRIADMFTPKEMEGLSTQLNLGSAAVSRHISELKLSRGRGLGHSDPRALDWAMQDQKHFQFLASQVRQARRQNNGGGEELDLSSLEDEDLFDLWEFSKFEADRAHRNIDHLTSGLSHLKGPTAEYLSGRHKLDARFYTILANKIEPMITPDMYERHYVGL